LALHAGGDLGAWANWRTDRHVARCAECRQEIAAFRAARRELPDAAEIPGVAWNRLAAQMKANIRLGLTLGELEEPAPREAGPSAWARPAAVFAGLATLLAAGFILQHNGPHPIRASQDVEVETTANGIQVRQGAGALGLLHRGASDIDVNYTPGAQGAMSAQNVDDTGHVTVTNVYAN